MIYSYMHILKYANLVTNYLISKLVYINQIQLGVNTEI